MRLGAAFGTLVAIIMVVGYLGVSRMDKINTDLNDVLGKRWVKLRLARESFTYSGRNSRITMEIFLVKERKRITRIHAERQENSDRISDVISQIENQCEMDREKHMLTTIKQLGTPYVHSYLRALHLLLDEHKRDAAATFIVQETLPALFAYHQAWNDFVQFQMEQVDVAAKENRLHYAAIRGFVLSLIVLAGVVAFVISMSVTRDTAREITARTP
jgi:methyl-accepting chemotaxis protein